MAKRKRSELRVSKKIQKEKIERSKVKKNPAIAALLNFFVWGLGYIYAERRVVFGALLVISEILSYLLAPFVPPIEESGKLLLWSFPIWLLMSIAFAYDAYQEAL